MHARSIRIVAIAATAFAGMATAVVAFEANQSRPGGVFVKAPASTPQACARACEDDSLCMAWTLTPPPAPACELKAVIPPARYVENATSGLSSRAPRLMRLVPPAQPPGPPAQIAAVKPAEGLRTTPAMVDAPLTMEGQGEGAATTAATLMPDPAESEISMQDLTAVAAPTPPPAPPARPTLPSVRLGEPMAPTAMELLAPAPASQKPPASNQPAARPPQLKMGR